MASGPSDDLADSLRHLSEGDDEAEQAPQPKLAATTGGGDYRRSNAGLVEGDPHGDFNDESGFRADDDIPVSRSMYASRAYSV